MRKVTRNINEVSINDLVAELQCSNKLIVFYHSRNEDNNNMVF